MGRRDELALFGLGGVGAAATLGGVWLVPVGCSVLDTGSGCVLAGAGSYAWARAAIITSLRGAYVGEWSAHVHAVGLQACGGSYYIPHPRVAYAPVVSAPALPGPARALSYPLGRESLIGCRASRRDFDGFASAPFSHDEGAQARWTAGACTQRLTSLPFPRLPFSGWSRGAWPADACIGGLAGVANGDGFGWPVAVRQQAPPRGSTCVRRGWVAPLLPPRASARSGFRNESPVIALGCDVHVASSATGRRVTAPASAHGKGALTGRSPAAGVRPRLHDTGGGPGWAGARSEIHLSLDCPGSRRVSRGAVTRHSVYSLQGRPPQPLTLVVDGYAEHRIMAQLIR